MVRAHEVVGGLRQLTLSAIKKKMRCGWCAPGPFNRPQQLRVTPPAAQKSLPNAAAAANTHLPQAWRRRGANNARAGGVESRIM